ncbi:type I-E CRISPR-associated protein Cas6/Cse3/CasE [Methylobacter tundripaludum]|uniref:CRISPR-associated protein, Cse3 family n=1 Tax=Methylobacter tundripaludum (strain ATCC BAA-1195 / DSM 17260 / SV96) TaxID=697282 RepID=G3IX71_METTV|nr:type I-E CRISPR-associated protein Cas6/Cse3/CasE [Methylobacter tundripaludum]EGW22008.1 CRISPR-associated protein, Cse3 family [Methylobacter tundripaludum SV96]
MYLSKIHIPWHQAQNPYQLHQALWRLFPGFEDADREFLFRVEQLQKGIGAQVLLQSAIQPQSGEQSPALLAQREYILNIQNDQRLRFRLRANPIKTIKDSSKGTVEKKGKTFNKTVRVPLLHEEQQQAWLERKLQAFAQLETLIMQSEPILYFRKAKEGRSGKIQTVMFDGVLTVTDVEAFNDQVIKGIGPAKAFGCGLLSLARI